MSTGYYGIITHDTPGGGSHRRLWESATYSDRDMAHAALVVEFATGKYTDTVGVSWTITETGGN
jgi:hypothetical protein